ncbi:MAG: aminopeptidase P family N-terminal domain-containing protein, partial [Pseudolabrys sp.]
MPLSERLNTPISNAELERRWRVVRTAMEKEKIDVLLMQNNNDYMGGYVRYFTDMPATNGYPSTVVFPRDDEMTVVCQGPFGGSEATAQGDQSWRGVKRILTTPSYASAHYTKEYDAELAATALKLFAQATIGYVGTYQMSYALLDYMKRAFPLARFVDATEMVDRIKVIKSTEEMELVKRAALMQDGAMRAAFAAAKPGMRDTEVAAVAQHYSQCHGSENGIYLCASMPLGEPSKFANRNLQNRVI